MAPTAATVSVSGRVVTQQGRGIRNVVITMTDSQGNTRTATTTSFGYYRFEEVAAGETYVFAARGKRFSFEQNTQVLSIMEDTNNINFVANEQSVFSVN
jgi:phage gp45-like